MPRIVAIDTAARVFQYKTLDSILYLNRLFFKFKKVSPSRRNNFTPFSLRY